MGRTARVVLVSGSIVCLLGLTAVLAGALPAARDGVAASPSLLAPPSAPGAPPALAGSVGARPPGRVPALSFHAGGPEMAPRPPNPPIIGPPRRGRDGLRHPMRMGPEMATRPAIFRRATQPLGLGPSGPQVIGRYFFAAS